MMKRLFFVLVACFTIQLAIAQIRKIPMEVTNAFAAKYPDAKNVEWKDKLSNFTASFTSKDSTRFEASFNGKGEWQLTEETIDSSALPAEVKIGFSKSRYADREVTEIVKIIKKEGEIQYRVLAKKSGVEKKYLYFNKDGRLVKETMTL
jgi:hypothetical protein